MDVEDLKRLNSRLADVGELVGTDFHKHPLTSEALARKNARRSVVVQRPVKAGELLTADALTCKRPGTGISPVQWDDIVGRRARHDLIPDNLLMWADLEE